jgi:hypothetical protein
MGIGGQTNGCEHFDLQALPVIGSVGVCSVAPHREKACGESKAPRAQRLGQLRSVRGVARQTCRGTDEP